jgi:hypothetical protein
MVACIYQYRVRERSFSKKCSQRWGESPSFLKKALTTNGASSLCQRQCLGRQSSLDWLDQIELGNTSVGTFLANTTSPSFNTSIVYWNHFPTVHVAWFDVWWQWFGQGRHKVECLSLFLVVYIFPGSNFTFLLLEKNVIL